MRPAPSAPPRASRREVEAYTALHEGLPPKEALWEWVPDPPSARGRRGALWSPGGTEARATEIQYRKETPPKDADGNPVDAADWWDFAGPSTVVREEYSYHHPWAAQAQPRIVVESGGNGRDGDRLWFYAGRYETTRRGIEDRVTPGMPTVEYLRQPHVQPEKLPAGARSLTTLGRLEWIRYKWYTPSGWRQGYLSWTAATAPEIAHDQQGNLHVLHGRYVITERGVEDTMAHARSSSSRARRRSARGSHHGSMMAYDNPLDRAGRHYTHRGRAAAGRKGGLARKRSGAKRDAHGRYRNPVVGAIANPFENPSRSHRRSHRRRHHLAYANPTRSVSVRASSSASGGQRAWRMIMNSVVVGGVAVLTNVGINLALSKLSWSAGAKAGAKIAIGLLAGVGLAYVMPSVPSVPAGVAVGGVAFGLQDLYNQYVAPRLAGTAAGSTASSSTSTNPVTGQTTTSTTQTSTTPSVAPGAQALLPGGIPAGYAGYNPAACAVGAY